MFCFQVQRAPLHHGLFETGPTPQAIARVLPGRLTPYLVRSYVAGACTRPLFSST